MAALGHGHETEAQCGCFRRYANGGNRADRQPGSGCQVWAAFRVHQVLYVCMLTYRTWITPDLPGK